MLRPSRSFSRRSARSGVRLSQHHLSALRGNDDLVNQVVAKYGLEKELFPARNRKFNRQFARYRRFDSAGEALRFAIEELPQQLLLGACLEVEEERFDRNEMRRLYDSAEFPLARRAAA
jgi:hypothetical protein